MPNNRHRKPKQGHPARTTPKPARLPPGRELEAAVTGCLEATLLTVKESEQQIIHATRTNGHTEQLLEIHDLLRTAATGLLIAHRLLNNQPDPRKEEHRA